MKTKTQSNGSAMKMAVAASLTGAALLAVFYVATRGQTTPVPPPPPPAPPTVVAPTPTVEPQEAPKSTARAALEEAVAQAERKRFVDARTTLARALTSEPDAATRAEILRTMLPIGGHLLKMAPDAADIQPYRVRSGDTLGRLAKRLADGRFDFGAIKLANRLESNNLRVGDTLRIPTGTFSIFVVKSQFKLYLMYEGAAVKEYPIAVGRGGENETPSTTFSIHSKTPEPEWYPPEQLMREHGLPSVVPPNSPDNPLGTRWIALGHESYKGFGIHGTNDDGVIGSEATFGCIRMHNRDVEELFDIVTEKMTVTIVD